MGEPVEQGGQMPGEQGGVQIGVGVQLGVDPGPGAGQVRGPQVVRDRRPPARHHPPVRTGVWVRWMVISWACPSIHLRSAG
ncbi:hypothetical protein GCM10010428_78280 [Actinosynnema pretiosum subsp. pretiosum]